MPFSSHLSSHLCLFEVRTCALVTARWDNLYERNSHLKCNARIKWEEYRISIGRQELNWLYAKYQPHGDPILSLCSFCRTEEEDKIHLYTRCYIVDQYWST